MTAPNNSPALSPLSLQRVRDLFQDQGWQYQETKKTNSILTAFAGIGFEITFNDPSLAFVTTVSIDVVGIDRFDEVLTWAEGYNNTHAFPSAVAVRDEQRALTALGLTYSMPGFWKYSDQQFADHVSSAIQGVTTAAKDFLAEFAPEALEKLQDS